MHILHATALLRIQDPCLLMHGGSTSTGRRNTAAQIRTIRPHWPQTFLDLLRSAVGCIGRVTSVSRHEAICLSRFQGKGCNNFRRPLLSILQVRMEIDWGRQTWGRRKFGLTFRDSMRVES